MRLALAAAFALMLAAPAGAAVVEGAAPTTSYAGEESRDAFSLTMYQGGGMAAPYFRFVAAADGASISGEDGCKPREGGVECPTADITSVLIQTLGGEDSVDASLPGDAAFPAGAPITVELGAGDDAAFGSPNADTIRGGPGDDTVLGAAGGDDVWGGDDVDTIVFGGASGDLSISLDDVANDGGGANVRSDVENIAGSTGNDRLTGSAAANRLIGAEGSDTLTGGAGADVLDGGAGADTIDAKDGVADAVLCGPGDDTVEADSIDSLTDCEPATTMIDDDNDGAQRPGDCNDSDAAIRPGAPDTPGNGVDEDCSGADAPADADGDGVSPPADCNDSSAIVRPGAAEVRGNDVDENCDGARAPALVGSGVNAFWQVIRGRTRVVRLDVRGVPAGGVVEARCRGGKRRGCPFTRGRAGVRAGRATLTKLFRRRRLRPGAVLEIRVTAPGQVGRIVRYAITRRPPKAQVLCLDVGSSRPGPCPPDARRTAGR